MATNRPQGDLVGWIINYWLGKTIKISFLLSWIENPILLMLAKGFDPMTPQSLSNGVHM